MTAQLNCAVLKKSFW